MHTKLTLRLEDRLIHRAKTCARRNGKSVSQLVGDFFSLLQESPKDTTGALPPITRSLRGVFRDAAADEADYHRYLEGKYR